MIQQLKLKTLNKTKYHVIKMVFECKCTFDQIILIEVYLWNSIFKCHAAVAPNSFKINTSALHPSCWREWEQKDQSLLPKLTGRKKARAIKHPSFPLIVICSHKMSSGHILHGSGFCPFWEDVARWGKSEAEGPFLARTFVCDTPAAPLPLSNPSSSWVKNERTATAEGFGWKHTADSTAQWASGIPHQSWGPW